MLDPSEHQGKQKKPTNLSQTLMKLWKYLQVHRMPLTIVLVMVTLSSLLALAGPFLVGMTIDLFISTGEMNGFMYMLLGLLTIYLLHSLTVWLQHFWMVRVSQSTVYQMRTQLMGHMNELPISYFDSSEQGDLMSRVNNDMENVSNTLNSSIIQVFTSIITLVGILVVMLWLSPLLTLVSMSVIPLMWFGIRWITKRTRKLFKAQQNRLGALNAFSEEAISGHSITKTFSQEERMIDSFANKMDQLKQSGFWAQVYSGLIPKYMNSLNSFSFAIIAAAGGMMAVNNLITVGVIVIFIEYSRQFTRPLNDLANQFNLLLSAIAGAERVFEVMGTKREREDETNHRDIDWNVQGELEFKNVSFSYTDTPTIQDVSFHVSPGKTVAFVGKTGAGKTTMMNLLTRFYDPDEGDILLDKQPIRSIKREDLREHLAVVLQDTHLFEGTVMENIRYGNLKASDDAVYRAAKEANAHRFIEKLSSGYETVLKGGGGISQGQKQLLAIARALLRNPKLLILDEATSSIDTVTELKIQQALAVLMEGRTSFVIAHRLNTIREADMIVIFDEGRIIEKGTHEQLLRLGGAYAKLHADQRSSSS
ncbi:LOW QUALITY PROTEIN: lipid A export ATP-binding/permease protein MsbA [Geomicrobium sp. JCM 19039]|nr:LOW QUALITY PROTEIN: lipid A export ATP-binding/permease protein MsbA [Geomicrobium sp. JCM 19039]